MSRFTKLYILVASLSLVVLSVFYFAGPIVAFMLILSAVLTLWAYFHKAKGGLLGEGIYHGDDIELDRQYREGTDEDDAFLGMDEDLQEEYQSLLAEVEEHYKEASYQILFDDLVEGVEYKKPDRKSWEWRIAYALGGIVVFSYVILEGVIMGVSLGLMIAFLYYLIYRWMENRYYSRQGLRVLAGLDDVEEEMKEKILTTDSVEVSETRSLSPSEEEEWQKLLKNME